MSRKIGNPPPNFPYLALIPFPLSEYFTFPALTRYLLTSLGRPKLCLSKTRPNRYIGREGMGEVYIFYLNKIIVIHFP